MFIFKRKSFICIFCGERKYSDEAVFFKGMNGFCADCKDKLEFTDVIGFFDTTKNINHILSPLFYKNIVRDAIIKYKFKGFIGYGDVFAHILCSHARQYEHLREFDAVVPVPISEKRLKERGFNQSLPLAKAVAEASGVPLKDDMLKKVRDTPRQSTLRSHERAENLKKAFWSDAWLSGKRIILVDDIVTTGCTMEEAARTIKQGWGGTVAGVSLSIHKR